MSSTTSMLENAKQEIARAYFEAIEAIGRGESKRWHLAHFKTTTDVIVLRLKQARINATEAQAEIDTLAPMLESCDVEPVQAKPAVASYIRPLLYCITGSLICVGLLVLIDLIHKGA